MTPRKLWVLLRMPPQRAGEQRHRRVVEEILGSGLPQAQGAAFRQHPAAGHGQRLAVQCQTTHPDQHGAEHEAHPGKAEDGRRIGGINGKQAVPHLDEGKRRTPQHVAEDGHGHRRGGRRKERVQF